GTPVGRPALVRLFASVLKREDGRYFLVTPVEKIGIVADDAPFQAVEMGVDGAGDRRVLSSKSGPHALNAGDRVELQTAGGGGWGGKSGN
ncbi:MAG: DUF1285 domain-containing protein, partial [Proteobacteria bacterium]|nr:DUF1285 domain-containing protein [Pseudomonadota bacterium]